MRTLIRFMATCALGLGLVVGTAGIANAAPAMPEVPEAPAAPAAPEVPATPEMPDLPDNCLAESVEATLTDPAAVIAAILEDPAGTVETDVNCVLSVLGLA